MKLSSIKYILGTLRNSDVKRTLMSNADVHYKFNHFKLDKAFHNTSITPFFLLCFLHSSLNNIKKLITKGATSHIIARKK
jgi:hypothetical protein